jgi:hypothetical protein
VFLFYPLHQLRLSSHRVPPVCFTKYRSYRTKLH